MGKIGEWLLQFQTFCLYHAVNTRWNGFSPTIRRSHPTLGGGRQMLSMMILSAGFAAAGPLESPVELAAWLDARLEANWRAKGTPARAVA